MFFCDPELSCTIMIGGLIEKLRRVAFVICNYIGIRYSNIRIGIWREHLDMISVLISILKTISYRMLILCCVFE